MLLLFVCLASSIGRAQIAKLPPPPDRFDDMQAELVVNHFPQVVHPTPQQKGENFQWYWKHNTAVMAEDRIQIIEAGAFLLIQDQWVTRVSFTTRQFSRLFDCPKGLLLPRQPYTFVNNWRSGNEITAGWAAWYFVGQDLKGNLVYGWGPIYTSDNI